MKAGRLDPVVIVCKLGLDCGLCHERHLTGQQRKGLQHIGARLRKPTERAGPDTH